MAVALNSNILKLKEIKFDRIRSNKANLLKIKFCQLYQISFVWDELSKINSTVFVTLVMTFWGCNGIVLDVSYKTPAWSFLLPVSLVTQSLSKNFMFSRLFTAESHKSQNRAQYDINWIHLVGAVGQNLFSATLLQSELRAPKVQLDVQSNQSSWYIPCVLENIEPIIISTEKVAMQLRLNYWLSCHTDSDRVWSLFKKLALKTYQI